MADFIKTHLLSIIWFIFSGLFFYMAWREWKKSEKTSDDLESMQPLPIGRVQILGIDFAEMLKNFKKELNKSTQESHRIATISYFLAGLTALASCIISLL